jgi:hypothetical protein
MPTICGLLQHVWVAIISLVSVMVDFDLQNYTLPSFAVAIVVNIILHPIIWVSLGYRMFYLKKYGSRQQRVAFFNGILLT